MTLARRLILQEVSADLKVGRDVKVVQALPKFGLKPGDGFKIRALGVDATLYGDFRNSPTSHDRIDLPRSELESLIADGALELS